VPGVHRNYCTNVQILGGIHVTTDDRECFTRWRFAQRNAPNIRLCKVRLAGPKATYHVLITRVHAKSIAQMSKESKGREPFIPIPEGRGTLAFSW
jgi:hypothetical protein